MISFQVIRGMGESSTMSWYPGDKAIYVKEYTDPKLYTDLNECLRDLGYIIHLVDNLKDVPSVHGCKFYWEDTYGVYPRETKEKLLVAILQHEHNYLIFSYIKSCQQLIPSDYNLLELL